MLDGPLGRQAECVALHVDKAGLNVKVARKLFPAHLHIAAKHNVGFVRRQSGRLAPLAPAPLEAQSTQHGRLGRSNGGAAGSPLALLERSVPHVGNNVGTAQLDFGRGRILVLVYHVLVKRLGHELGGLRLHVRSDRF